MSTENGSSWLAGFKADYENIFVEEWSPYLGSILLVMVIIGLMINGLFWGVFGGVKFWGDWFNNLIGLGPLLGVPQELDSFLMHRMSLMNIMLVLGSFCAALLSRQFLPRRPPKLEYIWAAMGGCLMGTGAALAGGCTTGGFFNPVLHASPAGWAMCGGFAAGRRHRPQAAVVDAGKYRMGHGGAARPSKMPEGVLRIYPLLGLAVVVGVLLWATQWYGSEQYAAGRPRRDRAGRFCYRFHHAPFTSVFCACLSRALHDRRRRHDQGGYSGADHRYAHFLAAVSEKYYRSLYRHSAGILDWLAGGWRDIRHRHDVRGWLCFRFAVAHG